MKKIKFVNDQEPNISAETLNELQDNVEAGVIEEAEKATDEALTRKVVSYRNVLVDEQALIKECGGLKLKKLNKLMGRTGQTVKGNVNFEISNKRNIIPISSSEFEQGGLVGSDGSNTESGFRARTKGYYAISATPHIIYVTNENTNVRIGNIHYYNENKQWITSQARINGITPSKEVILTPPEDTAFIRVLYLKEDNILMITVNEVVDAKIVLIEGNKKDYESKIFPLTLGDIEILEEDIIYKLDNKWFKTDTEITDTTLIAQLNNLENAQLYEDITNISITGDNLTPIADIDCWTWFKGESGDKGETGENISNIYSTEEQLIGKWIDGKPLYRKIINTLTPTTTANGTYVTNTTQIGDDIDYAFIEWGIFETSNIVNFPIPYTNNAGYGVKMYRSQKAEIKIANSGVDYSNMNTYISVLYTKTTD